jgi:hypothetical protein
MNQIGDEGVAELAGALQQKPNPPLTNLSLFGAGISSAGVAVLANSLKTNSTLYQLDLSGNSCGNEGTAALAEAIETNQQSGLGVLLLSEAHVCDEGAQALSKAIEANPNLTTVDVYGNDDVSPEVLAAIGTAVKANQKKKAAAAAEAASS